MSHFAKINSSNIVTEVIVSEKDFINSGKVGDEFLWVQTSYNDNFKNKFASVGYTWDGTNFKPPQPYASWVWNTENKEWTSPVERPVTQPITWVEATTSWEEI
jgi:hypothetical protein